MVLPTWASAECLFALTETRREIDIGGRLVLDMNRRRRTVALNWEVVRPAFLIISTQTSIIALFKVLWIARTGEESIQLHQELQVDIVALGLLTVPVTDMVCIKIDTEKERALANMFLCAQSLFPHFQDHRREEPANCLVELVYTMPGPKNDSILMWKRSDWSFYEFLTPS